MLGKPVIKETRVTVERILDLLSKGRTAEDRVREYDELKHDDVRAALAYASLALGPYETDSARTTVIRAICPLVNRVEILKWTDVRPYGREYVDMDATQTITPDSGLDEILGSTARVRVARLLVKLPDKEFTGREIARLLGTGHSTILPALRALVDRGLINERSVGRAHVFRMNKDHFLYAVLAAMFGSERKLVGEIAELIRASLAAGSTSIVLFGSRAKGSARTGSDIDLLIVSKEVRDTEAALERLRTQLRRRFGLELDAKVLTPSQLRSKGEAPYVKAARAEGITIAGVPLERVRAGGD